LPESSRVWISSMIETLPGSLVKGFASSDFAVRRRIIRTRASSSGGSNGFVM